MVNPTEETPTLEPDALLESILFVAPEPVAVSVVAAALEITPAQTESLLQQLAERLKGRGLQVQRTGDRVHLSTAAATARTVERFLGMEHTIGLSRAALETLAILAYRQPLTRPQVDAIRGVNSDSVLDSLMAKGLVEETGRTEGPGRPILYGTTPAFLQHFGLGSVADLPTINLDETPVAPEEPVVEHEAIATLKG